MSRGIWLVNLAGTPCAPSTFNPDNSLASLAGCLKEAGFIPLILDYQTVSFCESLMPQNRIAEAREIFRLAHGKTFSDRTVDKMKRFNESILAHQYRILDKVAGDLIEKAKREKPLFIGFKVYIGESSLFSRYVVGKLRAALDIPFVAGGVGVRILQEKYLQFCPEFDFLLDGEAEYSILEFAEFLLGNKTVDQVKGLIYRSQASGEIVRNPISLIVNITDLPDPCYDKEVYPCLYEKK